MRGMDIFLAVFKHTAFIGTSGSGPTHMHLIRCAFTRPHKNPDGPDWEGFSPEKWEGKLCPTEIASDFAFLLFGGGASAQVPEEIDQPPSHSYRGRQGHLSGRDIRPTGIAPAMTSGGAHLRRSEKMKCNRSLFLAIASSRSKPPYPHDTPRNSLQFFTHPPLEHRALPSASWQPLSTVPSPE